MYHVVVVPPSLHMLLILQPAVAHRITCIAVKVEHVVGKAVLKTFKAIIEHRMHGKKSVLVVCFGRILWFYGQ